MVIFPRDVSKHGIMARSKTTFMYVIIYDIRSYQTSSFCCEFAVGYISSVTCAR